MAKIDIIKLAERRDKKLKRANDLYLKSQELEEEAEEIDQKISDNCHHPKSHHKLKRFTNSVPQKTMWLCTLCYQTIGDNKTEEEAITSLFEEIFLEMPESISPKGKKDDTKSSKIKE